MKEYGEIAYETYCKVAGGKSLISGEVLPPFEQLSDGIKAAWTAAANAVVDAHLKNSSRR